MYQCEWQRMMVAKPKRKQQTEEWRPIPGYEGLYEVSNQGRVKRVAGGQGARKGLIRKLSVHRQGYLAIALHHKTHHKVFKVHRLVAAAFIGLCPFGYEVNHKNGIKADNRPENLEYVTPAENTRHAIEKLGRTGPKGEAHACAKFTNEQVRQIRKSLERGVRQCDIAAQYGVVRQTIHRIQYRKSWGHI